MIVAMSVFAWLAWQSHKEGGSGRTANAQPVLTGNIPEERYQLLARFVPPAYQPTPGAARSKEFQQAIARYAKGDDAAAIPGLRASSEAQPDFVEGRFYLGVCLLLTDQPAPGIEELRQVIAAGNTPFLERARFYLAKALIGQHDISGAQQQLESVVATHGDLEKQAQVLLRQIGE